MTEAPVPWCTVAIEETTCRALGVLARSGGLSYNEVIKMLVAEHEAKEASDVQ